MYNIFLKGGEEARKKSRTTTTKRKKRNTSKWGKKTLNHKIYIFYSFGLYFRKHSADFDIFIRLENRGEIYIRRAHTYTYIYIDVRSAAVILGLNRTRAPRNVSHRRRTTALP